MDVLILAGCCALMSIVGAVIRGIVCRGPPV